ncbi:MAG: acyltransferase [Pseudomonadales bacterium]|nr:acyltransferase [Pseudomonadales bacterium]
MEFLRTIARKISRIIYGVYLDYVYYRYGIEGINRELLKTKIPDFVLVKFGASIGEGTIVYHNISVHAAVKDYSNLIVGKDCRILRGGFIDLTEKVVLEDTSIIGINVSIITHMNVGESELRNNGYPNVTGPVCLKKGVVTCTGSIITHGVTIGEHSIVGAGALVSRNVEPNSVMMGNPARPLKYFRSQDRIQSESK